MKNNLRPLLMLNLASLCISSSGLLGKLTTLAPPLTICLRCIASAFFIWAFARLTGASLKVDFKKHGMKLVVSGLFLGAHWVTYFQSIRLSNVAVAMITLFTFPVITTLIEPFVFKSKLMPVNLLTSLLVMLGIYIIVPAFDLGNNITLGILWGLFSALLFAIRNLINKSLVNASYSGTQVMFYQVMISSIALAPALFIYPFTDGMDNAYYIVTLALVTTTIGHTLFVKSLKHFTASTASIINSMQPVYGIILAALFIGEIPGKHVYIGGGLILATVIIQTLVQYKATNA